MQHKLSTNLLNDRLIHQLFHVQKLGSLDTSYDNEILYLMHVTLHNNWFVEYMQKQMPATKRIHPWHVQINKQLRDFMIFCEI